MVHQEVHTSSERNSTKVFDIYVFHWDPIIFLRIYIASCYISMKNETLALPLLENMCA